MEIEIVEEKQLYLAGTIESVLIKGGVLISEVVLYTTLSSWDHAVSR